MGKTVLIIGGVRSGKSHYAQELARSKSGAVLFVATAEAGDEEMRQRIEEHKKARPATWRTLEVQSRVGKRIRQEIGEAQVVIVDCITLLVNNVFSQQQSAGNGRVDLKVAEKAVTDEINALLECCRQVEASFIMVSNEVGSGIVPADKMSRLYRDLLGKANQMLAQQADEVLMMVAGIPLPLKSGGSKQ
ncbi:MAG: bifunctional adenosylcobinamide kinase/adenosylcobinamide-phosphate guanylyltransferase [Dehalococcoidia bacterium]|nr:MAG: bifunctional adenosylcobinamide kinase/adenosylcobinamide-phosphate guanylyltransferase [Dehalococcoidia bacterium]